MGKIIKARANLDMHVAGSRRARVSSTQTIISNRLSLTKGADVASGANIALGTDGNVFDITGTTDIKRIDPTNFQEGSVITLQFDDACIIHHHEGTDTDTAKSILLQGATNWTTAAGDVITLCYLASHWVEVNRALVAGFSAVADASLTLAKLADSAGLSLIGRAANSTGAVADITAGTDNHVLRRSGTSIAFGTLAAGSLASDCVTTAKILDANVTTGKIAAQGVETANIKDANVTQIKLANDSVGTAQLIAANVTHAKLAANICGAAQALSGAGAINLTTPVTRYTSTGGAEALTLADSTVTGQRKRIIHAADGGSGVITAGASLHLGDSIATITFTNVRDWVELEWNGAAWDVIGYAGVTFA